MGSRSASGLQCWYRCWQLGLHGTPLAAPESRCLRLAVIIPSMFRPGTSGIRASGLRAIVWYHHCLSPNSKSLAQKSNWPASKAHPPVHPTPRAVISTHACTKFHNPPTKPKFPKLRYTKHLLISNHQSRTQSRTQNTSHNRNQDPKQNRKTDRSEATLVGNPSKAIISIWKWPPHGILLE